MFRKWKQRREEQKEAAERKLVQDNCPHEYHIVREYFSYTMYDSTAMCFIYCPVCDKQTSVTKESATMTLKKQAIREEYLRKSIEL